MGDFGDDGQVPYLVAPAIVPRSLAGSDQPSIRVRDSAVLRPWVLSDAAAVIRAFTDAEIQRWHVRRLDSEAEAHTLLTGWIGGWASETACHWALVDEDTGALLGRVALAGFDLYDAKAGVGYWMVPEARGRGMCTAAVAAASEWAFRKAGFHRLSLEHSTANLASCRVAEKARFTVEGVGRGAARHADSWHDMCLHSRLVTDS